MSEVAGQGPLDLFRAGEDELLSRAGAYRDAREHEDGISTQLREAKSATETARRSANEHGVALLNQIHESVTSDTDPSEYLAAILNTYHSGQRVGDEVSESLAPMRAQMQESTIPIGIVGSTVNKVVVGLSAGDLIVRRREEHEQGFDTQSGIRLAIPLSRLSGYSGDSLSSRPWQYHGSYPEAYPVGVVQWLSKLRVANTVDEIREANDTPHRPFSQYDTVMHHERDVKSTTGFVPVIAYGETAVSGLLNALYENRNAESWGQPPKKDDVLAAAISIDLDPEAVADIDVDALKERLHEAFLKRVTQTSSTAIHREASQREFRSGYYPIEWAIDATPQVMSYSGVTESEIVEAVRAGVERSFDKLRADDPLDVPSFWHEETDHRLLEEEAREKAVGIIAVRYGIAIEPTQLHSEELVARFAARLEDKQRDKERHEKHVRENPWLYRDRVTA